VKKCSYEISIHVEQSVVKVDVDRLREAIGSILAEASIVSAEISLAIVDDPTLHGLNRKYLDHDNPTDVLSFVLEHDAGHLIGEIIVSAETATAVAGDYGWDATSELLLYVIHGALHLVGYDDATRDAAEEMRHQETHYLQQLGVSRRVNEAAAQAHTVQTLTSRMIREGVARGERLS